MLGYDRTYISMIESGRRNLTDRGTLAHIARTLAIPPHVLGIADPDNVDFAAMLAFGTSVIRLAQIARQSGRAAEAASELWPLITRLEARAAAGNAEPETMSLLAQARMSLGVALGHLLPDERLATAALWTGRALRIAWHLGDRPLLGLVLRMHGNELRKAGHPGAGIIRPVRPDARASVRAGCPVQPVHRPGGPPARAAGDRPYQAQRPLDAPPLPAVGGPRAASTWVYGMMLGEPPNLAER
jgi:hypothetical protein